MTYENVCLHNMNYENMNKSIWKMKYIMSIRNTWIMKTKLFVQYMNYENVKYLFAKHELWKYLFAIHSLYENIYLQ